MKIPITTVETNVRLAESMIEYHINNMHHAEKCLRRRHLKEELIWENFEYISWCCEHSPVEGTLEISFLSAYDKNIQHIIVPVNTNFGVVCTREKENNYKITWSYSLS
jgi:hypothetical protein